MIKFCPNCSGELKQCGGVRQCIVCKGKYYILETNEPDNSSGMDDKQFNDELKSINKIKKHNNINN